MGNVTAHPQHRPVSLSTRTPGRTVANADAEQRKRRERQLADLRYVWGREYDIQFDGFIWIAKPLGVADPVALADSAADGLRRQIIADRARRRLRHNC
jgi:hypothetical protein